MNKAELKEVRPFEIVGDNSLEDFMKYLEAVGVKTHDKSFFSRLTNQIKAYRFTVDGKAEKSLWRLNTASRPHSDEEV